MRTQVTIVGAGPVGLMLAGELRLGGAEVVVCEQRTEPSGESRGVGFTRRAAETFEQRGLLERLGEVEIGRELHYGGVRIDSGLLDDVHFGVRGVAQSRIEEMLEAWVLELGATVLRGHELVGLRTTADSAVATVRGAAGVVDVTSDYLVGCDGARSVVRRSVGIDFPGRPATRGAYVADIAGRGIRPRAIGERVPGGMVMAVRLEEGVDRIVVHPDDLPPRDLADLTFEEIADAWQALTGESLHGADVRWVSCFTDASRQAARYRLGRVLLAGDAAHIHIPAGAQGLSVGVQDAVNLGWKLAGVVRGRVPDRLLDTYEEERHPVGAQVLRNTRAQSALYLTGEEMEPVRQVLRELVRRPDVAARLAGAVSGVGIRYDLGHDHPLVGTRLPTHWTVGRADGTRSGVAELLRPARGLLLWAGGAAPDAAGWADRVDVLRVGWPGGDARQAGLDAVLVRPDGYVAWAAPGCGDVRPALERWFGRAA